MDLAELGNLEKKDLKALEECLENYRDLKNALDSSEEKGIEKGKLLANEETKRLDTINFHKAVK